MVHVASDLQSQPVYLTHEGSGTGFSPSTSDFPVNIIPSLAHTHLQLHAALTKDKQA